jgi:hypothetical protein
MWFEKFNACYLEAAGDDGAQGGGSGGEGDATPSEKETQMLAELSKLRAKNTELLGEKKKAVAKAAEFDGMDPKELGVLRELGKRLENDQEVKLISEGKLDEVINRRTERFRIDMESKMDTMVESMTKVTQERDSYQQRHNNYVVDVNLRKAAEKEGVLPEAIDDVVMRGRTIFNSIEEDGNILSRDAQGELHKGEDGQVLTPTSFVKDLKSKAAYYWPQSKGGGLNGGQFKDMDTATASLNKSAGSGDATAYRAARAKMKAK